MPASSLPAALSDAPGRCRAARRRCSQNLCPGFDPASCAPSTSATAQPRPRYRVAESDLAAFLAARSAGPHPKISRVRRRRDPQIMEFF